MQRSAYYGTLKKKLPVPHLPGHFKQRLRQQQLIDMHIPDGFLDAKTVIVTTAFSVTGIAASLRRLSRIVSRRRIPLIGLAAAFIFVAQMLNFPVASGTSGHLLGATLAAVLFGPGAATIVMSSVIIIQALLFADGGILALGANIFNMAVVAPVSGYGCYRLLRFILRNEYGRLVSVGVASWFSTVVAAIFCAGELAWSGTARWNEAFPAMAGVHVVTGLGEAAITMLVIASVSRARPELLNDVTQGESPRDRSTGLVYASLIVIGLLLLVAPHASKLPDGLEKVASTLGFEHQAATKPAVPSPLSNYELPGVSPPGWGITIVGLLGAVGVFALSSILARTLLPRHSPKTPEAPPQSIDRN